MDTRRIFVIFDSEKYTKEDIVKDIKEEGYTHFFYFSSVNRNQAMESSYMRSSDEVWFFGDCRNEPDYKLARHLGKDCWQMK